LLHDYDVIGFVDDNRSITSVSEYPVLGTIDDLDRLLAKTHDPSGRQAQLVLFAIPTASGETRLRVLRAALQCRVEVRSLPSMFELRRGHPMVPQLRQIDVFETYGGFPWMIDRGAAGLVRGRRVAIVGAGGPLGRELARRVAHGQARQLVLVDELPRPLQKVADDLREHRDYLDCEARVADYADEFALEQALMGFLPEIVFFCGGLQHVPNAMLPLSHAARANVMTAATAAAVAKRCGASDFIMASTTRAAHPVSPFNVTKALAERAALRFADEPASDSEESTAGVDRYRNLSLVADAGFRVQVLRLPNIWSRDSPIVERLSDQLAVGGPIRVDPNARRRFLHAWQAAEAMLKLLRADRRSGLFASTCGEVVRIRDLTERLIWINGLNSGRDIRIVDQAETDDGAETQLWSSQQEEPGDVSSSGALEVIQPPALVASLDRRLRTMELGLVERRDDTLAQALSPSHVSPAVSA
jgi:FlaA1/EpsC-like NDP-sugar epimerase